MANETGLNILKMLEDHLDDEIDTLENEVISLENQREVLDARISKLRAIRRITNVPNRNKEGSMDRPGRLSDFDSNGSAGL